MSKIQKKRPIKSFPKEIQNTFNLLSYPDSRMEIMGTSSMKFKYASDVDLFDVIYVHTDLEAFKVRVKKFFQDMIKALNKDPNLYFIDFIALEDSDSNPKHWTRQEVLKGVNLEKVFEHKNVIKIDIAQYVAGRFLAVSNWYEFRWDNGKGINREKETKDTPLSLREDMKKFYYEKKNYLKVLKRYFIITQNKNLKSEQEKLIKIFESDLGKIYKIKSEQDTMISILEQYHDKTTIERVKEALQNQKNDIGTTTIGIPSSIFDKLDKLQSYKSAKSIENKLESIKHYLLEFVNKGVIEAIKKEKIGLDKYL